MGGPALVNQDIEKPLVPAGKNKFAQEIADYVKSLPQGFYAGPPKANEKSRALAEKVWEYYGFDRHVGEHFGRKTAGAIHEAFITEFTRTLHVNAGVLYFLNEKGPIQVTLGDGTKTTVKKEDLSPDNLAEGAAFLAFNAAIFGRVGATRTKELADSLFLHLVTSPANEWGDGKSNPFLADRNKDTMDALKKIRPISKHEYSILGTTINDAIKDNTELMEAYREFKKSFEKYSPKDIYSAFISNGYAPTTSGKSAGNVELLVWTVGSRAFSQIGESFKQKDEKQAPKQEEKKEEKQTKEEKKEENPTEKTGRTEPPTETMHFGEMEGKAEFNTNVVRTTSVEKTPEDFLKLVPKLNEFPKFNKAWKEVRKEIRTVGGINALSFEGIDGQHALAIKDLTKTENQQALVKFVATQMYLNGKTEGTIAAKDQNGNEYDVKYKWKPQGGVKEGSIKVSLYGQGVEKALLDLDCTYSKTRSGQGVDEVVVRKGAFTLTGQNAALYGQGSFAMAKERLQDGSFAVGMDMKDANGKKMHLQLSGSDFSMQGFKYDSEHPLRSTFDLDGRKTSIADLIADKQRGGALKKIRQQVKGGYLSFEAGFEPFDLDIKNLGVKGKGSGSEYTWNAEDITVGMNGKERIGASFKNSEFRLNFGGDITRGGMEFEWRANGKRILSFGLPRMSAEELQGVKDAGREFSREIFASIGKDGFYSALRSATRDFMREFKADSPNAWVELDMPGLLGAFEDNSWAGSFAKNGIAPGLLADAKNGGRIKFKLSELGTIAEIIGNPDPKARWSGLGNLLAPKLGLVSGQAMVDNTVMGMYFGNFNVQKELIDQAMRGYENLTAFAKRTTFGPTSQTQFGANYFVPLNEMKKDDFALYAWATAALNTFNYSPFGKPADLSNINFMQKSFDVTGGIGSRYANLDFGLSATVAIMFDEGISAENRLKPGDTFMIKLSDGTKKRAYGYAYARYRMEGSAGKLDVTFIGGVTPSAYEQYYARMNYDVMRFRAGAQISGGTTISLSENYGIGLKGNVNLANITTPKNAYFNAEISQDFKLANSIKLNNSYGLIGSTLGGKTFVLPYVGLGAKLGEAEQFEVGAQYNLGKNVITPFNATLRYNFSAASLFRSKQPDVNDNLPSGL